MTQMTGLNLLFQKCLYKKKNKKRKDLFIKIYCDLKQTKLCVFLRTCFAALIYYFPHFVPAFPIAIFFTGDLNSLKNRSRKFCKNSVILEIFYGEF